MLSDRRLLNLTEPLDFICRPNVCGGSSTVYVNMIFFRYVKCQDFNYDYTSAIADVKMIKYNI